MVVVVTVVCWAAALRGHNHFDQYTYYVYDNGDPGHPGAITVLATIGLWTVAVISLLLASMIRRGPWLLATLLFVVIAADYLFRFHNHFAGGDIVARLVYWSVFAFVLRLIWRMTTSFTPRLLIVAALLMFAASDVFDLLSNEDYGRGAMLEESAGCLGAWLLALAFFGIAQLLLGARQPAPEDVRP